MVSALRKLSATSVVFSALVSASAGFGNAGAPSSGDARLVTSCHGTEPFWSLSITPDVIELDLSGDDRKLSMARPAPLPAAGASADFIALYQGRTKEDPGRFMNVIIQNAECSDFMSDEIFGFSVHVLSGQMLLRGCCRM